MAAKYAITAGGNWNDDTTWSTTSGGGNDTTKPTASDDVYLDANSGDVTISANSVCRSLDCLGYTHGLTHNNATTLSIGDGTAGANNIALRFSSEMTYSPLGATAQISFISTSTTQQTIDFKSAFMYATVFNGVGGSWIFDSNSLPVILDFTLTKGSVVLNGAHTSMGNVDYSNANTRTFNIDNSTIDLFFIQTVWDATNTTNLTFSSLNSSINIVTLAPTGLAMEFKGGGLTYDSLIYSNDRCTDELDIYGSNTFRILQFDNVAAAKTLKFEEGTTTTITQDFNVNGVYGHKMTVNSLTPGSFFEISKAGGVVDLDYLVLQDCHATGGATFYAGENSTNTSGNTGWTFTRVPITVQNDQAYSAQEILNILYNSRTPTQYSEQQIANLYNGTPGGSATFQQILNQRQGRASDTEADEQAALFQNLATPLSLTGNEHSYSVQELLNMAYNANLKLTDIFL